MDQRAQLLKRIKDYAPGDQELIEKAIDFAKIKHEGQTRASGEPYYTHPVEVATILADIGLDATTLITAILHDTIEDTEATLGEIKKQFGEEIAQLVNGVTKLTKISFQTENRKQAENFRKLFIAISEDIRVLLVKLADRLHNMRTLHHITKPEKRRRIAMETMEIYAPLAERIGMQQFKTELQDISFNELQPEAYQSIYNRLEQLRNSGRIEIDTIVKQLKDVFKKHHVPAKVFGREKMPYSIWRKMERKNVGFEQITDIIAFRVIVPTEMDCYMAMGAIHSEFHVVPGAFKDFISLPKENGYRSLHTVVMGPNHQRIEIQIRTEEMHNIAEIGIASHWTYKQNHKNTAEEPQYRWIQELLSILDSTTNSEEFLENSKLQMYHDQVFCFTPKGRLIVLPKGATPVDFAFAVHSDIGRSCVGAKVNNQIVPLRTKLRNGDQVDIITSKSQNPMAIWENFVVTGKAHSEIRKYLRSQKKDEYEQLGRTIIEKTCESENLVCSEETLKLLLDAFDKKDRESLFIAVGRGLISQSEVLKAIEPEKERAETSRLSLLEKLRGKKPKKKPQITVPIQGMVPGVAAHFAACCHPLPGEKIIGIMTHGKGMIIHKADCAELDNFIDEPERWIDLAWEDTPAGSAYVARLKTILAHKSGSLGALANTIAQSEANINNLRITKRSSDFYEMMVDVEVKDAQHLQKLLAALNKEENILSVQRYKGKPKNE